MAEDVKQLFPALPENLKELSDDERGKLLAEHEAAKDLILEDNSEFLEDLTANEIIAQLKQGVEQIKQIKAVSQELQDEFEAYKNAKSEIVAELEPVEGSGRGLGRRGRLRRRQRGRGPRKRRYPQSWPRRRWRKSWSRSAS